MKKRLLAVGCSALFLILNSCGGDAAETGQPIRDLSPEKEEATPPSSSTSRPPPIKIPWHPAFDHVPRSETCQSLASKLIPAGSFMLDPATPKIPTTLSINPVDVFVTEKDRELIITFTETANECSYLASALSPHTTNQFTIQAALSSTPLDVGTHSVTGTGTEGGQLCLTLEEQEAQKRAGHGAFSGTAMGYGKAEGTITITKRTESMVEGTFDVNGVDGSNLAIKGTFAAPICRSPVNPPRERICCAI
jgi:hypothetical protein